MSGRAFRPDRVISGGQTGVDRGALDAAMELDLPHGGWCPRGRLSEDGAIPPRYRLTELDSPDYRERTERNVVDSDATLILSPARPTGGTELTRRFARRHARPHLVASPYDPGAEQTVRDWLDAFRPATLNVAGPRESNHPGVARAVREFLLRVWSDESLGG